MIYKHWQTYLINDDRPVSVDVNCLVYNHGIYLRKALDGMLMQKTTFPVRIIIHDDASTDQSPDIIMEYKERFPDKIIAIIEEKNLYQNGQSIWAKMFPYFISKYVAYCEGDDYWIDEYKLQKQVEYLESHPDCVACYHNVLPVDKNGIYDEKLRGMYKLLEEGDYTKEEIRQGELKTQTATLVRRNYNPWLSEEDKEIYATTHCNGDQKQLVLCDAFGRIHYLPDVMSAHRRVMDEGDSWTAKQHKKTEIERFIEREKRYLELCRLYNHLNKSKIHPYNNIIYEKYAFYRKMKHKKIELNAIDKRKIIESVKIPFFAYIVVIPSFVFRFIKKYIHVLFCL